MQGFLNMVALSRDDFCNCCPGTCIPYLEEGELCEATLTDPTNGICGPRLSELIHHVLFLLKCYAIKSLSGCDDENFPSTCVRGKTQCLQELTDYENGVLDGSVGMNQSPPVCDEDGFYSPVQCSRGGLCRKNAHENTK